LINSSEQQITKTIFKKLLKSDLGIASTVSRKVSNNERENTKIYKYIFTKAGERTIVKADRQYTKGYLFIPGFSRQPGCPFFQGPEVPFIDAFPFTVNSDNLISSE